MASRRHLKFPRTRMAEAWFHYLDIEEKKRPTHSRYQDYRQGDETSQTRAASAAKDKSTRP